MTSEPSPQAIELGRLLHAFMRALHDHSAGETLRIMSESGITLPQMVALHTLHREQSVTVTRMAELLRLSPSATSHLLDRLVLRGFAERSEDPRDRRQKLLTITPAGDALLEDLARSRVAEIDQALDTVEPELAASMVSVLQRVVARLDEGREGR